MASVGTKREAEGKLPHLFLVINGDLSSYLFQHQIVGPWKPRWAMPLSVQFISIHEIGADLWNRGRRGGWETIA